MDRPPVQHRDASRVRVGADVLDAGHGARAQELQQALPVVRWPVGQLERERRGQPAALGVRPKPSRRHPVAGPEQRVEAAHAREPARERDLGHRKRRVGQQALREQQPVRLRVLDRRDAVLGLEDAAQVATRHAHALREMLDPARVEHAVLDQAHGAAARVAPTHRRSRAPARAPGGTAGTGDNPRLRPPPRSERSGNSRAAACAPCTRDGSRCASTTRRRRSGRRTARRAPASAR